MKKNQLTYDDSARKMTTKARNTLLVKSGEKFLRAKAEASAAAKSQLLTINLLREAGAAYQLASGHEQLTFGFYELVRTQLPDEMTFPAVKLCVHLANKYPDEVTDLLEARRELQSVFVVIGEMGKPKRELPQTFHIQDDWCDFLRVLSKAQTYFGSLSTGSKSDWDEEKLDAFVRETQPFAEQHEEAKRELAAKRLAAGGVR